MLLLRSLVFNIAFYINLVVWVVVLLPTLVLPRRALMAGVKGWARTNLTLMRLIVGTGMEVRHAERIPKGALLVAAKHHSFWETFALLLLFEDPCYILKRELTWLPFFGWYLLKGGMIPVDRGARSAAMKSMNSCRQAGDRGRAPDSDFPGRHAPRARRRACLQVRRRVPLRRDQGTLRSHCAELRSVLAEAQVRAQARDDRHRDRGADPTRAR